MMVLVVFSGVSCLIIILHYVQDAKNSKYVGLIPIQFLYLNAFTVLCVFIPFAKSHALR